ncbi:conserved hypothetical protein [Caldicellulosiruptor hydrothermalis 108]|uniref:HK97 gp10 family phage protein n=1 Tax=Caldicellulosiruptor hydrothermalis (strain DSM 18901 / VKM B-2411 / 108) TaxID=632292 RepID=E4QE12_CALH1|nr:hypothetical protein [Caldicellulosiruptor hydrothermalis]ADQ06506.1 conserved hypothetical protein [Caldicellulosiruptor hydrothermalis 108]
MALGDKTREKIERKKAGLYALLLDWAGNLEAYAKENAPWTDRTGNARQGLHGGVDINGKDSYTLYLSHGVEYGIWLELAHDGNYAIVGPTIDAHLQRIKETIKEYWRD